MTGSVLPFLRPGDVLAGRYVLEREAGSGGVGTVYRAADRDTGAVVAVKVLRVAEREGGPEATRFLQEAALLAELKHPAIVRYLDHGMTPQGARYLVTEWIEGQPLSQALSRGRLGVAQSVAVTRRISEALGEAHRLGILHRDIKPGNIMLAEKPGSIRLIDFGFARRRGSSSLTQTGSVVGSPGYMAPEQVRGERDVGAQVDVFALGCVLYECLTGRPAFSGQHVLATLARILVESPPPVEELCPEVPAGLALLVSRMLAKSPALRPQDGARLAAELAAIEESPATGVPSPGSRVGTSPAHGSQALHAILAAEPEGVGTELAGAEEEVQRRRALLQEVAVPLGAQVEVFDDGAVMALLPARGALEAGRAAECALALRAFLPDTAMVLARWDAQLPAMDADNGLDSAVRELAAEGMRLLFSGVVTTRSPGIRLDAPTAELLPPGFGVHQAPSGRYLISGQGLPSSQ